MDEFIEVNIEGGEAKTPKNKKKEILINTDSSPKEALTPELSDKEEIERVRGAIANEVGENNVKEAEIEKGKTKKNSSNKPSLGVRIKTGAENFFKGIFKRKGLTIAGALFTAIGALIAKGINWKRLPEAFDAWKKQIKGQDSLKPVTGEEETRASQRKYAENYAQLGLNDPMIDIDLREPEAVDRKRMQVQTAEAGGPGWILPVTEKDGVEIKPDNADFLAEQLVSQLTGASKQEILDNWMVWAKDQQAFLDFLQTHGANSTVVNFWQCSIDLTQKDLTKGTWEDRMPGVEACAVKAKEGSSIESKPSGLAVPVEQDHDNTMEIASRIFAEELKVEATAIQPLIKPVMGIAEKLVVNHQLPAEDDVQELFTKAMEVGDQIAGHMNELAGNAREAIEAGIHQQVEAQQNNPEFIYHDVTAASLGTADSIGGMVLMMVALGAFTVHTARYLQNERLIGRMPEPVVDKYVNILKAVKDWQQYEKRLDRGMPDGFVPAGNLCRTNIISTYKTGETGREVVGEVIIEGGKIYGGKGNGLPEYKRLIALLKQGIKTNAWDLLEARNLLIKNEKLTVPLVRATDLLQVVFELQTKGQYKGDVLASELNYYD